MIPKACPGLDPGWGPVFGKDHAPRIRTSMRRLYLQVYLTIVASLVLVVLTAGLVWHFAAGVPPFNQPFEVAAEVIGEIVPAASAPQRDQQQAIERLALNLGADLALFDHVGAPLASAGRPLPAPKRNAPP